VTWNHNAYYTELLRNKMIPTLALEEYMAHAKSAISVIVIIIITIIPFGMVSVGNVGPKNDHVERSDLAKRFFIARWERERAKRAKQEAGA
jgi:hypothetical protein